MELNREQLGAVTRSGGHVLVLAGAGTGKTRVVIGRAAHLIGSGTSPSRILLLTFTRRAAREMRSRLTLEVGPSADDVPAGTFHHYCLSVIRRMPAVFGTEAMTVIDRDDQLQVMRMVRAGVRRKGERFPRAGEILRAYSYARNTNIPPREYLERYPQWDDQTTERALLCMSGYVERKTASGYLDFDDILYVFAERLHADERLAARLRGDFDHILVDEMQDTNPLQMLILEGLYDPALLFCVGDDAQSIYSFRGADFRNVHRFTELVPGSTVLKLQLNYRSTQGILDLANWLLAESPLDYDRRLRASRGAGPRPWLLDFDSDFDEAAWVVSDIVERFDRGARWGDHMVIARTGWSTRSVEATLIERKVPYRFIGGTMLFQAAHVKDVLCFVRSVAGIRDDIAWMRFLTLWPGIGERTAARVVEGLREREGAETGELLGWLRGELRRNPAAVDALERLTGSWTTPAEIVGSAFAELEELLEYRYQRWASRRRDLELLTRLAARHRSLRGFLETYALDPVTSSMVERLQEDDCVTLITAHSAKGTEADVCYLVRAEPGMYPHSRSLGDPDAEEEERRVLYVAMTRARDELLITRSLRRVAPGPVSLAGDGPQAYACGPAYLLSDVPGGLIRAGLCEREDPMDRAIRPSRRRRGESRPRRI